MPARKWRFSPRPSTRATVDFGPSAPTRKRVRPRSSPRKKPLASRAARDNPTPRRRVTPAATACAASQRISPGGGGKKEVARRGEIHARHVWRIETHAVDPPHQAARQAVEQGCLLDDVPHQDAGGVQLAARVVLALEHRDPRAAASQRRRAGQPREARPDHDAIVMHPAGPSRVRIVRQRCPARAESWRDGRGADCAAGGLRLLTVPGGAAVYHGRRARARNPAARPVRAFPVVRAQMPVLRLQFLHAAG